MQLIHLGVVDPDTDQLLFTMVIDMLAVLIHHIISIETNLESNRFYQLIVKRISKDTFSDLANSKAINQVKKIIIIFFLLLFININLQLTHIILIELIVFII